MRRVLCSLVVLMLCWTANGLAETKTLKVGVEDLDYYPMYTSRPQDHMETEAGIKDYGGACIKIIRLFEGYLNAKYKGKAEYQLKFMPLPVNRLYQEFLDGNLDFKFPDHKNWRTDLKGKAGKTILYSEAVLEYIDGVMVRSEDKNLKVDQLLKLGTVMGYTPWDYKDRIDQKTVALSENPNFESLLQQTILKRVQGAYINILVAKEVLKKMAKTQKVDSANALVFNPGLPHTRDAYRLSSIKHPELIEDFNRFMVEKKEQVQQIKKNYSIILP